MNHYLQHQHILLTIPAWLPWVQLLLIIAITSMCALSNWLLAREESES